MLTWRALSPAPGATPGAVLVARALERAGIRAAFTGRGGGWSAEPYASLNLSFVSGDDPVAVRRNRARVLAEMGVDAEAWTSGRQVHGARVARVGPDERGAGAADPSTTLPDTDALWTDEPGTALCVLTADCVPVLLAAPQQRRLGVVHAGWRGMTAGVIDATVDAMGGPGDLVAYLGPSIGPCCYEVGSDVAETAAAALGDAVLRQRGDRTSVDLWRGARVALGRAGVRRVFVARLCTRDEPHRFFSHRAGHAARQGLVAVMLP